MMGAVMDHHHNHGNTDDESRVSWASRPLINWLVESQTEPPPLSSDNYDRVVKSRMKIKDLLAKMLPELLIYVRFSPWVVTLVGSEGGLLYNVLFDKIFQPPKKELNYCAQIRISRFFRRRRIARQATATTRQANAALRISRFFRGHIARQATATTRQLFMEARQDSLTQEVFSNLLTKCFDLLNEYNTTRFRPLLFQERHNKLNCHGLINSITITSTTDNSLIYKLSAVISLVEAEKLRAAEAARNNGFYQRPLFREPAYMTCLNGCSRILGPHDSPDQMARNMYRNH